MITTFFSLDPKQVRISLSKTNGFRVSNEPSDQNLNGIVLEKTEVYGHMSHKDTSVVDTRSLIEQLKLLMTEAKSVSEDATQPMD